jgi:hypothetical protein
MLVLVFACRRREAMVHIQSTQTLMSVPPNLTPSSARAVSSALLQRYARGVTVAVTDQGADLPLFFPLYLH